MPLGQHLRLRCFLEGIEVPIISASLTAQPNAPSQCSVQIPATDAAFGFKPRTLVHLFFYDYWNGPSDTLSISPSEHQVDSSEDAQTVPTEGEQPVSPGAEAAPGSVPAGAIHSTEGGDSEPSGSTMYWEEGVTLSNIPEREMPPEWTERSSSSDRPGEVSIDQDENWKLFFVGEVIGFEFEKSAQSRSVTLSCMDLSVYWDTCYQYKVNAASLTGNGLAAFVGAGTTFFDTFFSSPTATIASTVARAKSVTQPELTGLLAGVVALLEHVGGVYVGNEPPGGDYSMNSHRRGRFKGCNDFFSIAELRLKLVYMISAASEDFSSQRVFPRRAFAFWGRRYAGRLGQIASFREILNLMNSFIFHTTMPCPICRFEPPNERVRTRTSTTVRQFVETPSGRSAAQRIASAHVDMVLLRSEFSAMQTRPNIPSTVRRLRRTRSICAGLTPILSSLAVTELTASIRGAADVCASTASSYEAGRMSATGFDDNLVSIINNLGTVLDAIRTSSRTTRRTTSRTVETGQRLHSQILRPEIFFVAPPRCNVFFPESYSQISFSRSFMQEVTRMRLTVSDEIFGPDQLLDQWYFAPDVEVLGARQQSQLGSRSGSRGSESTEGRNLSRAAYSGHIMDHELYVGVIPMFERMNEVNMYAAQTDIVTYRGARIPYVVRAANFQFFMSRFKPRTMSVAGKFNPFAAPGFPALVVDRYLTEPQAREIMQDEMFSEGFFDDVWAYRQREASRRADADAPPQDMEDALTEAWGLLRDTVPTQFTGLVTQMAHSISQNSAQSQFSLEFSKTHRENDELLGANTIRLNRRATGEAATRTYQVAAMDRPQPGQTGRYGGVITEVSDSTRTGSIPLFGTFEGDRPRRQQTTVMVGVERRAAEHGPTVTTMVGNPDIRVTFRAYSISERIERWRGEEVDVPLEDFLRPPWMSDVWRNDRIGAVYQQFFGTGAITDPISLVVNGAPSSGADVADAGDAAELDADAAAITAANPESTTEAVPDGSTIQGSNLQINVERATDLLVRAYSTIKHQGLDVHEFIRAYTWRPVATLTDMLGSRDLELDSQTGRVITGREGLHSRAFGHGDLGRDLRNLLNEDVRTVLGINSLSDQERENFLSRMDKRAEKAEIIQAYVDELWNNRGMLG